MPLFILCYDISWFSRKFGTSSNHPFPTTLNTINSAAHLTLHVTILSVLRSAFLSFSLWFMTFDFYMLGVEQQSVFSMEGEGEPSFSVHWCSKDSVKHNTYGGKNCSFFRNYSSSEGLKQQKYDFAESKNKWLIGDHGISEKFICDLKFPAYHFSFKLVLCGIIKKKLFQTIFLSLWF